MKKKYRYTQLAKQNNRHRHQHFSTRIEAEKAFMAGIRQDPKKPAAETSPRVHELWVWGSVLADSVQTSWWLLCRYIGPHHDLSKSKDRYVGPWSKAGWNAGHSDRVRHFYPYFWQCPGWNENVDTVIADGITRGGMTYKEFLKLFK